MDAGKEGGGGETAKLRVEEEGRGEFRHSPVSALVKGDSVEDEQEKKEDAR